MAILEVTVTPCLNMLHRPQWTQSSAQKGEPYPTGCKLVSFKMLRQLMQPPGIEIVMMLSLSTVAAAVLCAAAWLRLCLLASWVSMALNPCLAQCLTMLAAVAQ